MSNRQIYNVEYNIPRVNIQLPGRQNRSGDGVLRITPGMDEPFEFVFGNHDGVPVNLIPFKIKLVFWIKQAEEEIDLRVGQSKIILSREIELTQPYTGRVVTLLTSEDTLRLVEEQTSLLRWNLFMINEQGNVFPCEVARGGSREGTVNVDLNSGIPIADLIKSS